MSSLTNQNGSKAVLLRSCRRQSTRLGNEKAVSVSRREPTSGERVVLSDL